MARIFGAPLTLPAGKVARFNSSQANTGQRQHGEADAESSRLPALAAEIVVAPPRVAEVIEELKARQKIAQGKRSETSAALGQRTK